MSATTTSSSSANTNLITVSIQFTDGTKEDYTISKLKPVSALIEKAIASKGRAVYGLLKNGASISVKDMIKYVPLVTGDVLQEAKLSSVPVVNISSAAYYNTLLRNKVKKGTVSASDVIELQVYYDDILTIGKGVKKVLIEKSATIEQLKDAVSQILKKRVKELGLAFQKQDNVSLFGWSDVYAENRSYNPSVKVSDLKVQDDNVISEYTLPPLPDKSDILRRKVMKGEIPRKDVLELFLQYYEPYYGRQLANVTAYVLKTTTVDELKELYAIKLKGVPIGSILVYVIPSSRVSQFLGWKYRDDGIPYYDGSMTLNSYNLTDGTIILSSSNQPKRIAPKQPAPSSSSKASSQQQQQQQQKTKVTKLECNDDILAKYGIHDKKSLRAFALQYHPDKSNFEKGSKEYLEAEEIFKIVYQCGQAKQYKEGGTRKTRRRKSKKQRKQNTRKW